MQSIRVALIEDDADLRPALRLLIHGSPGFHCRYACGSVEEGERVIPLDEIDLLILDVHLPGCSGVAGAARFRARREDLPIMMFTVYHDDEHVFAALRAGASGYVLKSSSPAELLGHLCELHAGGAPMSPEIARRIVDYFHRAPERPASVPPAVLDRLTPREREVLDQLARGYLYKEIAARLSISLDTVKRHVTHIYRKLRVQNRTEALNAAFPRDHD